MSHSYPFRLYIWKFVIENIEALYANLVYYNTHINKNINIELKKKKKMPVTENIDANNFQNLFNL